MKMFQIEKPETLCERCGSNEGVEDFDGEELCVDCQMSAQDGDLYDGEDDDL